MDSNRVPSSRTLPNARSFGFAAAGILHILRSQPNARFHLAATLAVVGLAVWTRVTRLEWLALVLASGLVWTAEALNTALEAVVDLASPQVHPLAKTAKDVAAGAVLLAAVAALAVAGLVFIPALLR